MAFDLTKCSPATLRDLELMTASDAEASDDLSVEDNRDAVIDELIRRGYNVRKLRPRNPDFNPWECAGLEQMKDLNNN